MHAMVLNSAGEPPRFDGNRPLQDPCPHEVQLCVHAGGICRTDLHIIDGELTKPKLPLILGDEIVATVEAVGREVEHLAIGMRVGVPWLAGRAGSACIAGAGAKISVIALGSRAISSMAAIYALYTFDNDFPAIDQCSNETPTIDS